MSYKTTTESADITDNSYYKYIGYKQNNYCIQKYFSKENVNMISKKITNLLKGVGQNNRPIIIPDKTIYSVMSEIYNSYRPPTGDIYSRYIVSSGTTSESYVENMVDQVIEVIVTDVRNNIEIEENNKKLTIWTTLYGDFNDNGLRQHSFIKINNKRPTPFQFHMRY